LQRCENRTELKAIALWAGLVIDVLSMVIVLILSAYLFVHNTISLGTVVLILSYTTQLLGHTLEVTEQFGSLQEATACIERINEIYHTQSCVQAGKAL
jgi:ATP-binding cassette, subfamily B, bacterial